MRDKTIKKIFRKAQAKTDREMKKKNPDYKTRAEKSRELRMMKKRIDVMQFVSLVRNLQSSGRLNDELNKFQLEQPSELNIFLR